MVVIQSQFARFSLLRIFYLDTEFNSDEDSSSLSKRILRVADFTNPTASEKRLCPKGIIGSIQTSDSEFPIVRNFKYWCRGRDLIPRPPDLLFLKIMSLTLSNFF
jgi:hypothetical protein